MTNEVVALLSEAQELIRDPKNWCQDVEARDSVGMEVDFDNPDACQLCAVSALQLVLCARDGADAQKTNRILNDASRALEFHHVVNLNDKTDHDTVMQMFDLAKEMAAQEGAA